MLTQAPTPVDLETLHAKLDAIQHRLEDLNQQLQEVQHQRELWEDLSRDLSTVMEDLYRHAVEHLEELSPHVRLEDLGRLALRLLRSARLLDQALQDLEALYDLARDLSPVAHDAFVVTVEKLDQLEKKGYFTLAREVARQLDALVSQLKPEDVAALGWLLQQGGQVLRRLLQPEVREQLEALLAQTHSPPPSPLQLLGMMRDPDVRRGMALGLQLLKVLGKLTEPPFRSQSPASTTSS